MTNADIKRLQFVISERIEDILEGRAVVVGVIVGVTRDYQRISYSWDEPFFEEVGPPRYDIQVQINSNDYRPSMGDFEKISSALNGDLVFGKHVARDMRVNSLQASNVRTWGGSLVPYCNVVQTADLELYCSCRTIDANEGLGVITQS